MKRFGLASALVMVLAAFASGATLTVTKTTDSFDNVCDADCSLREALTVSEPGDTIVFASPLFDTAQTVTLTLGQLLIINKTLTIAGRGANLTSVSGNNSSRVFSIYSSDITLSGLTITGGRLNESFASGGGILNTSGTLTLAYCAVTGNSATGDGTKGGGGISNNSGTLNLNGTTVSGNSLNATDFSTNLGGGIDNNANGTLNLTNSTVSGNSVNGTAGIFLGGGIANEGTMTATNVTISANSVPALFANVGGGGVFTYDDALSARNTIIAGNSAPFSPNLSGRLAIDDSNIIDNEAAVRLAPLGSYGGPTMTHALLSGSSAVNAGNNCVRSQNCPGFNAPFSFDYDQRGRSRYGLFDIGAFEAPEILVVTNTLDSGPGSLRNALFTANFTPSDETVTFDIPAGDPGCADGACTITLTSGELFVYSEATAGKLAISNPKGTPESLKISGNNTSRVISMIGADVTLSGLTITGGRQNNPLNNFGGGINSGAGTLTLTNCAVTGNSVSGGIANNGGGIYSVSGTLNLTGTTVSGNTVTGSPDSGIDLGGGIYNDVGGTLNLTNSTVSGNSVAGSVNALKSGGGGIYNLGAVTATNATISGNSVGTTNLSENRGGGVYNDSQFGAVFNARNTIVSGNSAPEGPNVFGPLPDLRSNIIGNETAVRLAPLGFYGGPTLTHALSNGSSAVNAGNNCVRNQTCPLFNAPVPIPSDQRGAGRVGNVDIGAFELNNSQNGGNYRAALPAGRLGSAYSYALVPANGPFSYSVTGGALPAGVALNTNFAPAAAVALTGPPTQGGTFNFTVTGTSGANSVATDYQLLVNVPTAAGVSVSGRVLTGKSSLRNAIVTLTDSSGNVRTAKTGTFGYYRFDDVAAGQTVVVTVVSKRFTFAPRVVEVDDSLADLDFNAAPE
ncbi:MAG: hypothetical protein JSS81_19600 [Acidobacteria bacterium]|nr:hypothetical protein [Acidobacteriota bacterium]